MDRLNLSRALALFLSLGCIATAQGGPRAREAGVPFEGDAGPLDAITDVSGVEVGQATLISGDGALVLGKGPVRTGVTVIFPKGKAYPGFVYGGTFVANGTGEMTGRALIDELGEFTGPIVLTGSGSVGVAHDTVQSWYARRTGGNPEDTFAYTLPVVAETFDGQLNDTFGQHVKPEHVLQALDSARSGPVEEGSVGGGTGMVAFGFKAGIGTASRVVSLVGQTYTVGVLVQANFGGRRLAASPVAAAPKKEGSIVIVVATDAPLLPNQLRRVALRATHGMARVGGMSGTTSGDLFLAFSTAGPGKAEGAELNTRYIDSLALNPILAATVLATEEAIVNSLFAGRTMKGINGHVVDGLPIDRVRSILREAARLREP
jgi:L-aminopeptidase/D-esterase-like protein